MSVSTASPGPGPVPVTRDSPGGLTKFDLGLYLVTIFVWGTSWYAIRLQLGVVSPEVSLVWRFSLATAIMIAWVLVVRAPVKFNLETHAKFATLGVTIFSTNFALFYYAGLYVPSGLLAVMFSLSSIVNVVLNAVLFREKIEGRLVAGAVLGIGGIVCMFLPEVLGTSLNASALFAGILGVFAVFSFCTGNMLSRTVQRAEVPLLSANMWGMVYGTLWMAFIATLSGDPFIIDTSPTYLSSLFYLATFSTVVAFASYLTLVRRLGPGRASYATVMFPVVALAVSTLFEGYEWTLVALIGMALALGGNFLVLSRPAR